MTGLSTWPASTDARAPSIPATATMALAWRMSGSADSSRCSPETPISKIRSTFAPHISAVTAASSATGMSAVPAGTHGNQPGAFAFGFHAHGDRAGHVVIHGLGHQRPGCFILLPTGTGGQYRSAAFIQMLKNFGHMGYGFALAENHLREPGAQGPVMIQPGIPHIFIRQGFELFHGLFHRTVPPPVRPAAALRFSRVDRLLSGRLSAGFPPEPSAPAVHPYCRTGTLSRSSVTYQKPICLKAGTTLSRCAKKRGRSSGGTSMRATSPCSRTRPPGNPFSFNQVSPCSIFLQRLPGDGCPIGQPGR